MPQRAILHIGTEKTGTTSVQSFFARRRPWLNRAGFHYPRAPGAINHTRLFAYALSKPRLAFGIRTVEEQQALRRKLEVDLRSECDAHSDKTFLFSNEHLHSRVFGADEVARLRDLLARFFDQIDVVVYLRRQDELAVSLYSTILKVDRESADVLVDWPIPYLPKRAPEQFLYYDYAALTERWAEAFGAERLTVRRFPADLDGGSTVHDLCRLAGLPTPPAEPPPTNESLAPDAQEFLRLLNPHLRSAHRSVREEIVEALSAVGAGRGRLPSRAAAAAFYDRFRAGNEAVRAARFPDADTLFPEDFSRYPEVAPASAIDAGTAARIAADVMRRMVLAFRETASADTPGETVLEEGSAPRPRRQEPRRPGGAPRPPRTD